MPRQTVEEVRRLPSLPPRAAASNKGTYGRVLMVAGSRGMSGAAVLSGSAALRGGAGLVQVATPAELLPLVAAGNPCYLTAALPGDDHGRIARHAEADLLALSASASAVAIGPGLGRSDVLADLLDNLLPQIAAPVVLDADGLNAFERKADRFRQRSGPLILTPHPGEFARLTGTDVPTIQRRRGELSAEFAAMHQVVLVLKGHQTVVTDGRQIYLNPTGNPGLASGGTGDVLTGLVAALLAQGLSPFAAAQLAVHWHGLAADLARDQLGEVCLIASDLLDYLPRAWEWLKG